MRNENDTVLKETRQLRTISRLSRKQTQLHGQVLHDYNVMKEINK